MCVCVCLLSTNNALAPFTYSWDCNINGLPCPCIGGGTLLRCQPNSHWRVDGVGLPDELTVEKLDAIKATYPAFNATEGAANVGFKDATPCMLDAAIIKVPALTILTNGSYQFKLTVGKPGLYLGNPRTSQASTNIEYV